MPPCFAMVRQKGLEPPQHCCHTDLNRTRLPVPPLPQKLFSANKIILQAVSYCQAFIQVNTYHLLRDHGLFFHNSLRTP